MEAVMETVTEQPEGTTKQAPPYFAFRTLLNTLEDMKRRGVPNRIDRTFLTGMSGAGQTQFIAGMRSLGLIDGSGVVQPRLDEMAKASPTERQRLLSEVLHDTYPEAVELGKTNATTGELLEVFKEYGLTGDTARKAIAFYLNAAKYAGDIPLSPMFQTPKVTAATGTRKRSRRKGTNGHDLGGSDEDDNDTSGVGISIPEFHPTLAGVLSEFPKRGRGWTKDRRDTVMKMFEMAVDFTIPITDEDEIDVEEDEELEEETTTLETE
jgi:hypothetical protein